MTKSWASRTDSQAMALAQGPGGKRELERPGLKRAPGPDTQERHRGGGKGGVPADHWGAVRGVRVWGRRGMKPEWRSLNSSETCLIILK